MTRDQLEHAIRATSSRGSNIGLRPEAHDLAASKLFAYREKDRDFGREYARREIRRIAGTEPRR